MKRLRKVLKWSGIALTILITALLLINAYWVHRAAARLEHEMTLIRTSGAPVTLEEWMPEAIADEENAAYWLQQALPHAKAINEPFQNGDSWLDDPSDRQRAEVVQVFEDHAEFFDLVRRAAACTQYVPQVGDTREYLPNDSAYLEQVQGIRCIARNLYYQAELALHDGDRHKAMENAVLTLKIAKHFSQEPTVTLGLVAVAIRGMAIDLGFRAMAAGDLSDDLLREWDAELAADDLSLGLLSLIETERCVGLAMFEQFPARRLWLGSRPLWDGLCADYLETMRWAHANAHLPCDEFATRYREEFQEDGQGESPLIATTFPAIKAAHRAFQRALAMNRLARIAVAIRRCEGETALSDAPTAEELGLDDAIFKDPMRPDGGPLHVARDADHWLLYTVGEDGRDSGGIFLSDDNPKGGPDGWDYGCRLPVRDPSGIDSTPATDNPGTDGALDQ